VSDGICDQAFQPVKRVVGNHCADILCRAETESLDAGLEQRNKFGIDSGGGDDALDSNAVLPRGLEAAAEESFDNAGKVTLADAVEDYGGVLPAQLGAYGDQSLGGGLGDFDADGTGTDEGDVRNAGVGGEVTCGLGPADDGLDESGIVAVSDERAANDAGEVGGTPGCLLRDLDDDAVAGEYGADHGADEIVEGVVPAHEGGNNAERLVVHRVSFVGHQEVGRATFRAERLLAVLQSPFELLGGDEDLSQLSVNFGLAGIEARNAANLLLIVKNVLKKGPEDGTTLAERRGSPFRLGGLGSLDGTVDGVRCRGVYEAEELTGSRGIALDSGRA